MTIEKGNYCIGISRGTGKPKTFLFKVGSLDKGIVTGVLEKNCHIQQLRNTIELPTKDIVVNLGADPFPGKVHGQDTSVLYRGRKEHDSFGTINWFYKPEKEVTTSLNAAFNKCYTTLKQNKLDFIVDPLNCIWESLPFNGEKFAGMYIRSNDVEKKPHRFQIRPEIMPATDYPYVIYHELGHHLHFEYMTGKKLNASWIRLYNTSIKVSAIKREKAQELLDGLLGQSENMPSDFKSVLSEEDSLIYKLILKAIGHRHSLSVKELDLLFEAEYYEDIKAIWPTRGISIRELAPIISDYATKNYKETIAEAFAFYMTKKKLPKEVHSLLEKSISYGRANSEKR